VSVIFDHTLGHSGQPPSFGGVFRRRRLLYGVLEVLFQICHLVSDAEIRHLRRSSSRTPHFCDLFRKRDDVRKEFGPVDMCCDRPLQIVVRPCGEQMSEFPDVANFFVSLHTSLSRRRLAGFFAVMGWCVRKCSWTDFAIHCPFAELVIEAESPILLHGIVADVEANADRILAPLRKAGVDYHGECYYADGSLLRELRWGSA
jgi:hypothetical protein